jgi:hypothetical protein
MTRREMLMAACGVAGVSGAMTLRPSSDDVLVVKLSYEVSDAQRSELATTLKRVWPDNRILVLAPGVGLEVVHAGMLR